MTDTDLVLKKLALIEQHVHELRTLARPEQLGTDVREERFVEHTLQLAIQAALDVASHVVSDNRLGEPQTNQQLFELLAQHGWLDAKLLPALRGMAGFRNLLVHGYANVDIRIVQDVLANHLGDLLAYTSAIRGRLNSA